MNADGTFSGNVPAGTLFPGAVRLLHEIFGNMQGKVTGTSVAATEFMTYTVGCQSGAIANISISGSR